MTESRGLKVVLASAAAFFAVSLSVPAAAQDRPPQSSGQGGAERWSRGACSQGTAGAEEAHCLGSCGTPREPGANLVLPVESLGAVAAPFYRRRLLSLPRLGLRHGIEKTLISRQLQRSRTFLSANEDGAPFCARGSFLSAFGLRLRGVRPIRHG